MNDFLKIRTPKEALDRLMQGNLKYINSIHNSSNISNLKKIETTEYEQNPYAVIITCSDSRVPTEYIFSAGIGELFVIRTAGNIVSEFDLGSIEFGVSYLKAKVIIVMGHSNCGAIAAAFNGRAESYINYIIDEIKKGTANSKNVVEAENDNISYIARKIYTSPIVKKLVDEKELLIIQAKYDIGTGKVDFLTE